MMVPDSSPTIISQHGYPNQYGYPGQFGHPTPLHQTLIFGFKHGNPFGYIQYLPHFPQIIEITILDDLGVSQASCH